MSTETTDIADRLWESDVASALTNEGAREIERLRDQSASRWAEIEGLKRCLMFFASVIKSGEPWTETCEAEYRKVMR